MRSQLPLLRVHHVDKHYMTVYDNDRCSPRLLRRLPVYLARHLGCPKNSCSNSARMKCDDDASLVDSVELLRVSGCRFQSLKQYVTAYNDTVD